MRLILVVLAVSAFAQSPQTANTLKLDGAAPGKATLKDMAWLAGHWRGDGMGGLAEEVWSQPAGGAMMGMFRLLRDGKVSFYELITIAETDGSLTMRLKHFHPDMKGWEQKDDVREFRLVRADEKGAWFEGMTLLRDGPDRMTAIVAIRSKDGSLSEGKLVYQRQAGSVR
jgi:hypothetical protein